MYRLSIITETDAIIAVSKDDAPQLFEAFESWRCARERSTVEAQRWQRVLDAATAYCESDGEDAAEDVAMLPE